MHGSTIPGTWTQFQATSEWLVQAADSIWRWSTGIARVLARGTRAPTH